MTEQEEIYYWDGIQRGKYSANRNILECVIKTTTISVALETLTWMMYCEFIEQKVPREERKEKALQLFKSEIGKWE